MSNRNDPVSEYLHRWGAKAVPFNNAEGIESLMAPVEKLLATNEGI